MKEFKKLSVDVPNYYIPKEYDYGGGLTLLDFKHIPINDEINTRLIRDLGGIETCGITTIYSDKEKENILEAYKSDRGVRIWLDGGYYKINELNGYLIDMIYYSPYELRNIDNFMDYIVFICEDLGIDFKCEVAGYVDTINEKLDYQVSRTLFKLSKAGPEKQTILHGASYIDFDLPIIRMSWHDGEDKADGIAYYVNRKKATNLTYENDKYKVYNFGNVLDLSKPHILVIAETRQVLAFNGWFNFVADITDKVDKLKR